MSTANPLQKRLSSRTSLQSSQWTQTTRLAEKRARAIERRSTFSRITSRIYISTVKSSQDLELLQRHKITHILSIICPILSHCTVNYPDKFTYKLVGNVADTPSQAENLGKSFYQCNDFIHECLTVNKENRILIHCEMGISRSVSVATAYLMVVTGLDSDSILTGIRAKRHWANPNDGFRKILIDYGYGLADYERRRLRVSEDMTNETALELYF